MSRSEKRYFMLDAKKSGRSVSRYLTLFNHIGKMEQWDEERLKKKFPKNLSSDKAYLYEAILRSMRDYRSASSKAAQIKERLTDARFLYERGLYGQSNVRIAQAKNLARQLEDNFSLLEINKEEQVSLFDRKAGVALAHIEQLNEDRERILEAIQEELIYLDLYYRLLIEVRKEFNLKDEKSINELNARLPMELLNRENFPASPHAQRGYFLCKAAYYNLIGDLDQVYKNQEKVLEWWESHPFIKEENYHRYINNVYNLINTSHKINKYKAVYDKWVKKLEAGKNTLSYHNQKAIFRTLSVSRLLHLLNEGDFKGAKNILPEIIEGANKFGLKNSMVLAGNIFIVNFLVKDYKSCIAWAEYIIKSLKKTGRDDIRRYVRVFTIIAYYELGDIDKAEGAMRAINRHFKAVGFSKERFEYIVVNKYLRKIFNAPISEYQEALKELYSFLNKIKTTSRKELPIGLDELLIWIEDKL